FGAGLLIRSLVDLNRVDLGFEHEHVMTARLGLFEQDYPDADARQRFHQQLLERLGSEAGVVSASVVSGLPGVGGARFPVQVEGETYDREADVPIAAGAHVSPGFFETFGVRLLDGRDFRVDEPGPDGVPVAIVNRSFAENRL